MNSNDKADYYISEVIKLYNKHNGKRKKALACNEDKIKKLLVRIIDTGNDYLLTNAFLYHLAVMGSNGPTTTYFEDTLQAELFNLLKPNKTIETIAHFIEWSDSLSLKYEDYLNEYEMKLISEYQLILDSIRYNTGRGKMPTSKFFFLEDIVQIITAYFIINKKDPSELSSYADPYITNYDEKLDEMELQIKIRRDSLDYYEYDFDKLASYLIHQLDNKRKLIR